MRHSDWKKEVKLYCFANYMDIYVENTKDSNKSFYLKIDLINNVSKVAGQNWTWQNLEKDLILIL